MDLQPKRRAASRSTAPGLPAGASGALTVGAAIATVAIVGIGLALSATLLALRLAQAGYSGRAIGLNTAAGGLAALATGPFVPALARRFGVKQLLIFSLVVGAFCLAAFAASNGYWAWFAIRAVFGAALTVLFAVSEFWISSAAAPQRRGLITGVYTSSFALGIAAGPSFLALTGTKGGCPFLLAAALSLLACLPIGLLGRRAPMLERPAGIPAFAFVARMPTATLAALVYGAIETAGMGLLPVYALRSGLDATTGAALVTIFALGNGLFQTPIGIASDRLDRGRLLPAVALFGAVGALLLPVAREAGLTAFLCLLFVWSGAVGSLYALGLAELGSRHEGAELARGNAAYIMLYAAGMLIGPPLMGVGLDLAPAGLFVALALLLAVYFGLGCQRGS